MKGLIVDDKQVLVKAPSWLGDIDNDNVAGAIFALIFSGEWGNEPKKVDNLKEYIAKEFDDMSEDEIEEICQLLIKHKMVK